MLLRLSTAPAWRQTIAASARRHYGEEVPNRAVPFKRMPKRLPAIEYVPVPAADAGATEIARVDELADDALDGALGDANLVRDFTQPGIRIAGEADQDVSVVGEEGPVTRHGLSVSARPENQAGPTKSPNLDQDYTDKVDLIHPRHERGGCSDDPEDQRHRSRLRG